MLRSLVKRSQRYAIFLVAVLVGAMAFMLAREPQPAAVAGGRIALATGGGAGICDEHQRSSGPNTLLFVSCAGFLP